MARALSAASKSRIRGDAEIRPALDLPTIRDALNRSSFAWALHATGDHWSVAVLRSAFLGAKTFEQFRAQLSIPRQTLSERLRQMTDSGLFEPTLYQANPPRHLYRLTAKGRSYYPTVLMTWAWRRKWVTGVDPLPRRLIHKTCCAPFTPICVCATCRQVAQLHDMTLHLQSATRPPVPHVRSRRFASSNGHDLLADDQLALGLGVDRWAQLILAAMMLGCRRFDELQAVLGIGSNILSSRLDMLCSCGMVRGEADRTDARRWLYRPTPMSEDLFSRMTTLAHWHRSHEPKGGEPIVLRHADCGSAFKPLVVCSRCIQPVRATDVRFEY